MPTYDFRCTNGHSFERFFGRISEAPMEVQCPECGAMGTRQISGGAGLIFKGSGFYITDYGKDGKKDQRAHASHAPHGHSTTGAANGSGGGSGEGAASSGSATDAGSSSPKGESGSAGASPSTGGGSTPATSPKPPSSSASE